MSIIVIDDGSLGMQRLIWCDWHRDHQLFEVRLPDHVFEQVVHEFLAAATIPPRPITLFDLFHQAGGGPIDLDGQRIYRRYQRQVRGWTEVEIRRAEATSTPVQGMRIKSGKVDLEYGGEYVRDLILWADETPKLVRFQVVGQQGAVLKIWNVWRSEHGQTDQDYGNAGIIVVDEKSTLRIQCSDGIGKPDFHDLVVEFMFHPGKPT